jgi:hypothetical protein
MQNIASAIKQSTDSPHLVRIKQDDNSQCVEWIELVAVCATEAMLSLVYPDQI